MEVNIHDLVEKNIFYVSSEYREKNLGKICNLRFCQLPRMIDVFPYNMESLLRLESIHRSIHKNEPWDISTEHQKVFLATLPIPFFSWMASNSWQSIIDHWTTFFAMWGTGWGNNVKPELALDQSPKMFHETIKRKHLIYKAELDKLSELEWEEAQSAFSEIIKELPSFLDIRKVGYVDYVCSRYDLHCHCFSLSETDLEHRETDKILRVESDPEAFAFWKYATGRGQYWQRMPGCDAVAEGHIYLLTDGELFKIGYSSDHPSGRLRSCQTGNARELSIVASIRGPQSVEKTIHRMFAAKRVRGEWFALSDSDIDTIWRERNVAT